MKKPKMKERSKDEPKEGEMLAENPAGTLLAHIPVEWVKIIPPRQLTEEEKQKRADAIRRNIFQKGNTRRKTV